MQEEFLSDVHIAHIAFGKFPATGEIRKVTWEVSNPIAHWRDQSDNRSGSSEDAVTAFEDGVKEAVMLAQKHGVIPFNGEPVVIITFKAPADEETTTE